MSDEEAEAAAGFERRHAAELEEEGRRHTSVETDAELQRLEEELEKSRVGGIDLDDDRKKRGRRRDPDEDDDDEDGEAAAAAAVAARKQGFVSNDGAGKYFTDMPEDRMGDLSLSDPNEMKRALGPSVRFAQHAMLLAAERGKETNDREASLDLLATLYTGVSDRAYANKALREFGHATGIIDIYPLELMNHLLEHVPGFCTKVRKGSFLRRTEGDDALALSGTVGAPMRLDYDPELRVRGFALAGGGRPGYLLEPLDEPGAYQLIFLSPGTFTAILSAITKDGWLVLEEIAITVAPSEEVLSFDDITGLRRERDNERDPDAPRKKKEPDDLKFHFPKRI